MLAGIFALGLGLLLVVLFERPALVERWKTDRGRAITVLATAVGLATCVYCGIWYGFMWLPPEESKAALDIWFAIMAAVSLTLHGAALGLVGKVIGESRQEEKPERPTSAQ